ncbi:hypothetical protein [Staphylococcus hominis]|uniref:hypothetical protein n=1 Tax=Staphylococcus hominis TaxID=1290 RepID=UPI00103D6ABB|nr:hypothetical protein [Staphylococcus hominis]TBW86525.1 hypothetical protein EQ804_10870 [Staphylococcus hominis]
MENLFSKIIDLLKFEWYTKNLTLIFFSITILGLYDVTISPIFNKIPFIHSIINDISKSGTLLNSENLLLLTPYLISAFSFSLGVIYFFIWLKNKYIDLEIVLFNYIGMAIKILLLFYPLSIILLCVFIHQPTIIKSIFGNWIFFIGSFISIIIGIIGLLISLFSGLNIPYRKKDMFKD